MNNDNLGGPHGIASARPKNFPRSRPAKPGAACVVLRIALCASLGIMAGCHLRNQGASLESEGKKTRPLLEQRSKRSEPPVKRVIVMYDQRPWLNMDAAGDLDPEGIAFRVFLDGGKGRGVCRDGSFQIDLYRITRNQDGAESRVLASDWNYPTTEVPTIARPGLLGQGYFVRLVWASKSLAGSDIEMITTFKDSEGRSFRSPTKRLRVPKYTS